MGPFVDGDEMPTKTFLVAASVTLHLLDDEARADNDADYQEKQIKIMELITASSTRELDIKVQQLFFAEMAKLNFRVEVVHFNEKWCREISKAELKTATSSARTEASIAVSPAWREPTIL